MISGPWTAYLITILMRCVFSVMDLHKFTCMHFVYALYVWYRSQNSTISDFVHAVCMDMLQDNALKKGKQNKIVIVRRYQRKINRNSAVTHQWAAQGAIAALSPSNLVLIKPLLGFIYLDIMSRLLSCTIILTRLIAYISCTSAADDEEI